MLSLCIIVCNRSAFFLITRIFVVIVVCLPSFWKKYLKKIIAFSEEEEKKDLVFVFSERYLAFWEEVNQRLSLQKENCLDILINQRERERESYDDNLKD